ncbi:rhomboid family intramembrane serine protease [Paenibacillus sp. y28]|uniref:rhomboid family intramembrane serine protease n=1 Tax=Paenibacillus sp. y28 TaxID=3129110 RepID=UPI0030182815
MIFLRNEKLTQYLKWYPVTSSIIVLNLLLFVMMELIGDTQSNETLIRFGAMYGDSAQGIAPEYWRYFVSMFLHIGFTHLLFNCFSLYVFAPPLERLLGPFHYLVFYLFSGFAGNAASVVMHNEPYMSAGASGAIYGLYAAYLFLALFRRGALDLQSRQTIIIIVVIGVLYSVFMPEVNLYGHVGGFIGGWLLFWLLLRGRTRRQA